MRRPWNCQVDKLYMWLLSKMFGEHVMAIANISRSNECFWHSLDFGPADAYFCGLNTRFADALFCNNKTEVKMNGL